MNTGIPISMLTSPLAFSGGGAGLTAAPDLFSSAVTMVSALAITLGILFFIFYLLRRFYSKGGGSLGSGGLVRVVSTTYLGSKQSLVLADVAGEKFVLGLSPQGITLLAKIDRQESLERISAAEKGIRAGRPFLWHLESFMAKHIPKREGNDVKQ